MEFIGIYSLIYAIKMNILKHIRERKWSSVLNSYAINRNIHLSDLQKVESTIYIYIKHKYGNDKAPFTSISSTEFSCLEL